MSTATILIIEDELSYWSHYKRKLAPLGFLFEMARHPKEAETVMKGFQPNLILLDLSFDGSSPDMGLNFLSKIRKDFPDIKVLIFEVKVGGASLVRWQSQSDIHGWG